VSLPSAHTLRSMIRVISLLDEQGETTSSLATAFRRLPSDGEFGHAELSKGAEIATDCGLVLNRAGRFFASDEAKLIAALPEAEALRLLLEVILRTTRPPWVFMVGGSVPRWEYVPEGVMLRFEEIVPDVEDREALLGFCYGGRDLEHLAALGEAGEKLVVDACKTELRLAGHPELVPRVVQVSKISDALGYDVSSPRVDGGVIHLEVKTQGAGRDPVRLFLTRNEAERARSDPDWRLVVCSRTVGGEIELRGWCCFSSIADFLPLDSRVEGRRHGRWTEVELFVSTRLLQPGLPIS
jgi:Protein NO VEIN, C-terminal